MIKFLNPFYLFSRRKTQHNETIENENETKDVLHSCIVAAGEAKETFSRLQSLTETLNSINFSPILDRRGVPELREIRSENGYIFQIGIHKSRGLGICKLFMTKNSDCIFKMTVDWSMLIVWKGKIRIVNENFGQSVEIGEKQYYEVEPKSKITLMALEDSWMLSVAIPPPSSWPEGHYLYPEPQEVEGVTSEMYNN